MILPNFTDYGYEVIKQLNHNYLALEVATQNPVVIKTKKPLQIDGKN